MTKISVLLILAFVLSVSTPAYAAWGLPDTWSWQAIKEKVQTKIEEIKKRWNERSVGEKTQASESLDNSKSTDVAVTQASPIPISQIPAAPQKPENLPKTVTQTQEVVQRAELPKVTEEVKKMPATTKMTENVPFSGSELKLSPKAQVPVFDFASMKKVESKPEAVQQKASEKKSAPVIVRVKKVPLLNVGLEATLDPNAFKKFLISLYPALSGDKIEDLDTPQVMTLKKFKEALGGPVVLALPAERIIIPVLDATKKVTIEKINKINYDLDKEKPVKLEVVKNFTAEELKLLRGLILFDKKDQCHFAAGIFADLLSSSSPEVRASSQYHIGICLREMKLPTEALYHLSGAIKSNDQRYLKGAIKSVVEDLPQMHEDIVGEALSQIKDEKTIPKESMPAVDFLVAKYLLKKGQTSKALERADKVPASSSKYFYKAQFLAGVAEYELNRHDEAIARYKKVINDLGHRGGDKAAINLMEMNLGRIAFQKGRYKDSLEAFQKIQRDSPLWMDSLTEQGWAQLVSKDYAGAIGNMHSIHSPYFDGVYKPDTYIVRSIGYLNICQYGDSAKWLSYLDHTYKPWLEKLDQFNKAHGATSAYESVAKYLREGNRKADVEGLPYQMVREAARQRDFLNAQENLNQLIDESGAYGFIQSLIVNDKKTLTARRAATVNKIAAVKERAKKANVKTKNPQAEKSFHFEITQYQDFLDVYDFKMATMKEGEEGLRRMAPKAVFRVTEAKKEWTERAGKTLKVHFVKIAKNLRTSLDNNELVKYEIYAGSGENLRYRMAGGKAEGNSNLSGIDRRPNSMNWNFDGEYWDDEIGNYRSSLKNNCQAERK